MIVERDNETRIVTEFPRTVEDLEHVWIPMSDGVRLSARIWMPEDADESPVPAILEYIPYRKRDGTRVWDEPRHRYWAGHGYACIRLDIRGTGESEGLITDEYARQEQDDAVEAIAWIAAQPWCTGKVGMTGISWGGFNSLQVAARRPPALRAIITHCSTDDRYADDVHFMGGCPLIDNFFWGSAFFMLMARPGDPEIQGERWREQWMERLEHWEPVAATIWQRHPQRDDYWKHGSVCENHADIECAVYAVGGWNDGYSNAVPRLLANLQCPKKGLVGPWGHKYPQDAIPGPSIGFLQHALRWWDHWLKDDDTGIMDEAEYTVWLDEPQTPRACLSMSKGRWVTEPTWPSPHIEARTLFLNADGLAATKGMEAEIGHRSPETVGAAGGVWCPYGLGGSSPDLPVDQREDDAKSLCFDGVPLPERLEILGAPVATLRISIDEPQGMVVVRLNDLAPDGTSVRVTYGLLNLSQREDRKRVQAMVPGEEIEVRVALNDCAHAFPAGHRIRVAISTSYFPIAWTAPRPFTLKVRAGASALVLPARPPRAEDTAADPFPPPEMAPLPDTTTLAPAEGSRHVERNVATGEQVTRLVEDGGVYRLEAIDLECADGGRAEFRIVEGDPASARAAWHWWSRRKRGDWQISVEAKMKVALSKQSFHIESDLEAFEGERRVFSRTWDHKIPRDHL